MQFGDFAGNEWLKRQLASEADAGRFPHALMLEGDPGSGRRTLAMLIARAAVCTCPVTADRPCGSCAACVKTEHPDITLLGGEGRPLSVDAIRDLRQEAYVMPNESAHRVMILADAQTMTPQAQNALLKILEEPPAHAIFILTCENRAQLLETVRSRCVCMTLSPVEWEEALPVLRKRLPAVPVEELRRAHNLFGGMIGQVIAGIADGTLRQVLELVPAMAAAVADPHELTLMRLTARLEKDKELTAGVLGGLQLVFRDALILRYGGEALLSTAPEQARLLAGRLSGARLSRLVTVTEELRQSHKHAMNNTLLLTRISACLRQAAGY